MADRWERRELLALSTGLITGCGMPSSPDIPSGTAGRATVSITTEPSDTSSSGSTVTRITYDSSPISIEWHASQTSSLSVWTSISRNGTRYTGQLRTLPKSPLTRPDGDIPSKIQPIVGERLGVPSDYGYQGYRLVYQFQFPVKGIPMRFRWTVFGFPGKPYVVLHANLTNESTRGITIDEDEGNRHAGYMVLRGASLSEASISSRLLKFKLSNMDPRRFHTVPQFTVFTGSPWATIYGPDKGITYGYLTGDTAPIQWVTGLGELDLMTNGTHLEAGESLEYYVFVGLHDGGSTAPKVGKSLYQEAKELV